MIPDAKSAALHASFLYSQSISRRAAIRFICTALVFFAAALLLKPALAFEPLPGLKAAPLTGPDLISGEMVSLDQYNGKWVVLRFIKGWHDPNISMLPETQELHELSAGENYAVLVVSRDESARLPELKEQIDDLGLEFPILHRLTGEEADDFDWDIPFLPTTIIINPMGIISYMYLGSQDMTWALSYFRSRPALEEAYDLKVIPQLKPDGSLELLVGVISPERLPLGFDVSVSRDIPRERESTANEGLQEYEGTEPGERNDLSYSLIFRLASSSREARRIVIPAEFVADATELRVYAIYTIPESARSSAHSRDALSLRFSTSFAGPVPHQSADGSTTERPPLPDEKEVEIFLKEFDGVLTEYLEPFVPQPGLRAAALSGRDLHSGELYSLADYEGQWVLIAFLAGWSDPSNAMLSQLQVAHSKAGDYGLEILAVSWDNANTLPNLEAELEMYNCSFPLLHELAGYQADKLGWTHSYLPLFVIVEPSGEIKEVVYGVTDLEHLIGNNVPRKNQAAAEVEEKD